MWKRDPIWEIVGSFDAYSSRPSLERLVGIETATARALEKRLWLKWVTGAVEI